MSFPPKGFVADESFFVAIKEAKMRLKNNLNTHEVREALLEVVNMYQHNKSLALSDLIDAIRAVEPPIPWVYLDPEWQYMAMDEDGSWAAYDIEPNMGNGYWYSSGGHTELPCTGSKYDWQDTLCERE